MGTQWGPSSMKQSMGPVIVGREAFFLVRVAGAGVATAGAMGGLVGGLIASAFDGGQTGIAESDQIVSMDIKELPHEILEHPDWPAKRHKGSVTIIPKDAVDRLTYPWWGGLCIFSGDMKITTNPTFMGRDSALRFLKAREWDIAA